MKDIKQVQLIWWPKKIMSHDLVEEMTSDIDEWK